jgi:nucleoside phosphorylase
VKPLLVVTGTRREGALAAGPGVTVLAGGGDSARLAEDLTRLAPHACGIISFGTGGGLVPGLRLGDMVIGQALTGALTRDCDAAWAKALAQALPQAQIATVFANGALLATADAKASAAASGAIIADMESHLAGAAAARHVLPFAILRCISDLADAALPPAVAVAMRPDGGLALGAVLGSILRQPEQLPALIRTGIGFGRAFAGLRAGTRAVSPRTGFDQR